MTTVRELIEKLQTLDPEMEVKVVAEYVGWGYSSGHDSQAYEFVDLDLAEHSETFGVYKGQLYLGDG